MPIFFNEKTKTFRLDAKDSSYAFRIDTHGYLRHLYFGAHISDTELVGLDYIVPHISFHVCPAENTGEYVSLDLVQLEYPCFGRGDFRGTALTLRRNDTGTSDVDIKYVSHKIYQGKPMPKGLPASYAENDEAETLEVTCLDEVSGTEVLLYYTAFKNYSAIARRAVIKNVGNGVLELQQALSAAVDFLDAENYDVIHLWGDWAKERTVERIPIIHGTQSISSARGTSSHAHNPFLALCEHDATETSGNAYGFSLVYSGNFVASAEMDQDCNGRVLIGINPKGFRWILNKGQSFETPEAICVYSSNGIGEMSRTYHKLYANNLVRGKWKNERRPILINNWEATYFNFDEEKIYEIAKEASKLGVEMLVLDDGWFGKRNDDSCGLGDWFVNENKLHGGLEKLVSRIHKLGMKFGIWFEPEMISRDSDLYRAHPDWTLQIADRSISVGRNQYVLDMSRQDVQDYLFNCFKNVLSQGGIDYVKWDFNRNFGEVGSALSDSEHQGEVAHRYYLGLYALLERLHNAYPDLLLEGCSGGGGRFDAGWLYYAPQIWTSDNSDAIERLAIQYGTSFCYPPSSMGAHVSAVPNHQVHRTTPLQTRGNVAAMGTFGYELDLRTLSDEEKEIVKLQCQEYRLDYDTTHNGDFYRLISPLDGKECAWEFVSANKSKVILTYVLIRAKIEGVKFVKLQGLDANKVYVCKETGEMYHGDTLMNVGFCVAKHLGADFISTKLHFNEVK